jgi:hypothetical protein
MQRPLERGVCVQERFDELILPEATYQGPTILVDEVAVIGGEIGCW